MIRILGRYELLDQVGSGGMAVVYRGRDTALDREVAVKLLHPHLASAPESRARFAREARAVARLAHRGIVEIYDYSGDGAAESYLVTEFVAGRTLRAWAAQVGVGYPEIGMLLGRALADALVHAHSAGVIHRDLKPENVLVREGDTPALKLADFGIARILASEDRMTMTGALVGSPHHMAPEIVEGRDADARSDLFSLGTILYWLATGRFPFAAPNPTAILRRVLEGDFEDPRLVDPRVADPIAEVVTRCLALDPAKRPASAAEVRDALDRVLAQVGLERPDEALSDLLRDAAAFKAAFPGRAIATLTRLGDAALHEGASARALGFYGRVLALEPGNAAVLSKLARLSRRRRVRRAAAWGAAAIGVFAAVAVSFAAFRPDPADRAVAPAAPAAAEGPPLVAAAPAAVAEPAPPPVEAPSLAEERPPPLSAQRTPAGASAGGAGRPRSPAAAALVVYVRPYAERALLDGNEVAREQQVVHYDVPPGRPHVIQIEHPCCTPFVREITAEQAASAAELRVPLEPKPARLRVDGDPALRVYVDGGLVGTAGESQRTPLFVPVPAGGASPYEAQARIRLEGEGAHARELEVTLRAGGDVSIAAAGAEASP